jgi:beta-glucanase (GH16 family)
VIDALEPRRLMSVAVTSLILMNADTGKDIETLTSGVTLNLKTLPTRHLNVRAALSADAGSVRFGLDAQTTYHLDNTVPFSLIEIPPTGPYVPWTPAIGRHTVTATPHPLHDAQGPAGTWKSVTFNVIDYTPPPVAGNWSVKFIDEFDKTPAAPRWVQRQWDTTHVDGAANVIDPSATTTSGGLLSLTARRQRLSGFSYVSGLVNTGGIPGKTAAGFAFKYGYVEARIKVAAGKGLWSAFWMLPTSNPNGSLHDGDGEIDIIETIGSEHRTGNGHVHRNGKEFGHDYDAGVDLTQAFHTYGVDWEPNHLTWFIDGKPLFTITDPAAIPQVAMYLIFNLTVGTPGTWPGAPDSSTTFPSSMQVQWVRVWQKS